MKLLFINDVPFNPSFGGIERVTDILSQKLSAKGYIVYHLTGASETNQMDDNPAHLYFPHAGLLDNENNFTFLTNLVEEKKIDIIINQRGLQSTFNKILTLPNVKTISVFHSRPQAYLFMAKFRLLAHEKTIMGYLKLVIKFLFYPILYSIKMSQITRQLSVRYTEVLTNSSAVVLLSKSYIQELLDLNTHTNHCPIYVIPNPNTYQSFLPKDKYPEILYVGRLSKYDKNPLRLLNVWRHIHFRNPSWKLIFVGDGDAKFEMENYVATHQITNVEFKGHSSDVKTYYSRSEIVCLTSNFEGWGMSLTEGMSCGCIPICFNSFGAASDIIDDGINGYLIPPFDILRYAKKLEILMRSTELRDKMRVAAMQKVLGFSPDYITAQWEVVFDEVCQA